MKEITQRIEIAKVLGWKAGKDGGEFGEEQIFAFPPNGAYHEIGQNTFMPDFLNDLNAMHEAEKVLDENQDHPITYWEELEKIVGCLDSDNGNDMRKVICATAPQRAEAFLKTLGLWQE
jgi:hypothetical protein